MIKRKLSIEQVRLTHHNHGGHCRMCALIAVTKAKAEADGRLDAAVRQLASKLGIETTDPGLYVPEVKGMLRLHQRAVDKTSYHHMVRIPEMNYEAEKKRLAHEYSRHARGNQEHFTAPILALSEMSFADTPDGKKAMELFNAADAKERARRVSVAELLGCKGIFFEDERDDSSSLITMVQNIPASKLVVSAVHQAEMARELNGGALK